MGNVIKSLSKEAYKTVKALCRNGFRVLKMSQGKATYPQKGKITYPVALDKWLIKPMVRLLLYSSKKF